MPRKAAANSCFTSCCIFRRYIVTVGSLICNLHRKVNILEKISVRSALLLLSASHNVMYYNDNVVWPRFLKFLRYYISYVNSERGILHYCKYVALFRIIYQKELSLYQPLLLFIFYHILSLYDTRKLNARVEVLHIYRLFHLSLGFSLQSANHVRDDKRKGRALSGYFISLVLHLHSDPIGAFYFFGPVIL